jgi:hypothetical protein
LEPDVDFPKDLLSLFVIEIGEPRENDLRVVIAEGLVGPPTMMQLGEARPVAPGESSRVFELVWRCYVAYSVRNESFASPEQGEDVTGDRLKARTKSAYLDYVRATTIAMDVYPGSLTHWSLYTICHCIDVVSNAPPEIRQIAPLKSVE